MNIALKRMTSGEGNNVVELETHDATYTLTKTERDTSLSRDAYETLWRSKFALRLRNELHIHKNRDGTYTYAVGANPTLWPEDNTLQAVR